MHKLGKACEKLIHKIEQSGAPEIFVESLAEAITPAENGQQTEPKIDRRKKQRRPFAEAAIEKICTMVMNKVDMNQKAPVYVYVSKDGRMKTTRDGGTDFDGCIMIGTYLACAKYSDIKYDIKEAEKIYLAG